MVSGRERNSKICRIWNRRDYTNMVTALGGREKLAVWITLSQRNDRLGLELHMCPRQWYLIYGVRHRNRRLLMVRSYGIRRGSGCPHSLKQNASPARTKHAPEGKN